MTLLFDLRSAREKLCRAPTSSPQETSFTCDWGDCEGETTAWRYSGPRLNKSPLGWLPVCAIHASAADAVVAHNDGSQEGRTDG